MSANGADGADKFRHGVRATESDVVLTVEDLRSFFVKFLAEGKQGRWLPRLGDANP